MNYGTFVNQNFEHYRKCSYLSENVLRHARYACISLKYVGLATCIWLHVQVMYLIAQSKLNVRMTLREHATPCYTWSITVHVHVLSKAHIDNNRNRKKALNKLCQRYQKRSIGAAYTSSLRYIDRVYMYLVVARRNLINWKPHSRTCCFHLTQFCDTCSRTCCLHTTQFCDSCCSVLRYWRLLLSKKQAVSVKCVFSIRESNTWAEYVLIVQLQLRDVGCWWRPWNQRRYV